MKLNDLRGSPGSHKRRRRKGRGIGSGMGKKALTMSSAPAAPAVMLKGRYLLTENVRHGAQATVTQAFDRQTSAMVAIKRVRFGPDDARGRAGFEREAESLQALTHPNIVKLLEIDRDDDGNWFLVLEWAQNDRSRRRQPAIVDAGPVIWVNDTSERTIAAALRLGQQRYGNVSVFGDEDYLRRCATVSERLGIPTTVITVAEGQRRAAATVTRRSGARRRALEVHTSASDQRRRWLDGYRRAIPVDVRGNHQDETLSKSDIPHRSAAPTLSELIDPGVALSPSRSAPARPRPAPDVGI